MYLCRQLLKIKLFSFFENVVVTSFKILIRFSFGQYSPVFFNGFCIDMTDLPVRPVPEVTKLMKMYRGKHELTVLTDQ